ncbi:hypothetical protein L596_014447 [Steinernema carpocapsae]|uniref:Uncharacterized protein n=1 Tax=Steinernema carpocapsae TaxID=34508 RepID=A0A4U5NCV8_STECR|nr:hypothetical protein L596_014447 [Steinernema carpocapsae]
MVLLVTSVFGFLFVPPRFVRKQALIARSQAAIFCIFQYLGDDGAPFISRLLLFVPCATFVFHQQKFICFHANSRKEETGPNVSDGLRHSIQSAAPLGLVSASFDSSAAVISPEWRAFGF